MTATAREALPTQLNPLLAIVFAELDRAGITYALLRGYEEVLGGAIDGDVDLLVDAKRSSSCGACSNARALCSLRAGARRHTSSLSATTRARNGWIKLDVLTELAYGQPVPALRSDLAAPSLEHRLRYGPTFVLAAEEEFLTLLLHCLLDKQQIEPKYRARLAELAKTIEDQQRMQALVARYLPAQATWYTIRQLIAQDAWEEVQKLRSAMAARLQRRDPLGTRWRRVGAAAAAQARPPHARLPHQGSDGGAAGARWRRQDHAGALAGQGFLSAHALHLYGHKP